MSQTPNCFWSIFAPKRAATVLKLEPRALFRESICLTTLILGGYNISMVAIISQSAAEGSLICRHLSIPQSGMGSLKHFKTLRFWEIQSKFFQEAQ